MKFGTAVIPAICLLGVVVFGTMSPENLRDTGNSLARQAFDAKDLVLAVNSTGNAGPMQDIFEEMDDLYITFLANIQLIVGSKTLPEESEDVQLVYEAFSYLVQGMFELMDALGGSATNFIALDKQNEFRVPATIREVGGVADAWMFNMISLFPSNSSYADQAANQKNQVDSHFRRSIAAYHLATAKTGTPYGNITNIVSTDALGTNNPRDDGSPNSDGTSNNGATSSNNGTPNKGETSSRGATPNNTGASNHLETDGATETEACTRHVETVTLTRI